jgi:hypothetical protein
MRQHDLIRVRIFANSGCICGRRLIRGRKPKQEPRAAEFRRRLIQWKQTPESSRLSLRALACELGTSHQLLAFYLKRLEKWQAKEYFHQATEIRTRAHARGRLHPAQIKMARLFARNGYPGAQELLQKCLQVGPKKTKRFAEIVKQTPSQEGEAFIPWARDLRISHTWLQKLVRRFEADPSEMYREARRCGDPTFARLTRARESTRRMRELGELRGSRLAKIANFLRTS